MSCTAKNMIHVDRSPAQAPFFSCPSLFVPRGSDTSHLLPGACSPLFIRLGSVLGRLIHPGPPSALSPRLGRAARRWDPLAHDRPAADPKLEPGLHIPRPTAALASSHVFARSPAILCSRTARGAWELDRIANAAAVLVASANDKELTSTRFCKGKKNTLSKASTAACATSASMNTCPRSTGRAWSPSKTGRTPAFGTAHPRA